MHAAPLPRAYTDNRMPRTSVPAPAALPHFRPEALTFLRNLAKHNDREWFTPRKAQFEAELKEPMLAVIRKITDAMTVFSGSSRIAGVEFLGASSGDDVGGCDGAD